MNLATGLEDPERVTVAMLVAGAAAQQGKPAACFLTKEAVRLVSPGYARGTACDGCPPIERLLQQFLDAGGELLACPICFHARALDESAVVTGAQLAGATPMLEWTDRADTAVFSY